MAVRRRAFEYRSEQVWGHLPVVHVAVGAVAIGLTAMGAVTAGAEAARSVAGW